MMGSALEFRDNTISIPATEIYKTRKPPQLHMSTKAVSEILN